MSGAQLVRCPQRFERADSYHVPPRATRLLVAAEFNGSTSGIGPLGPGEYQSAHHSYALPNMSCNPNGFAFFVPTGCANWTLAVMRVSWVQAISSKTLGSFPTPNSVGDPPRQANSHCASVGSVYSLLSLLLSQLQNAMA